MHAVQSYQKTETPQYVQALLKCSEKKVCTNLSDVICTSHDTIYREIEKQCTTNKTQTALEEIAHDNLNQEETYLIHDDTQLTKIYAKSIEGLDVGFDGSLGRAALGLKVITSLLTDTHVSVPIEAVPYISKELAQATYKSKCEIAIAVTKHVVADFKIKRMLADAHFSAMPMLSFLHEELINYLMKITRSKVVTIDGVTGQLKNILRLKKNNRMKAAKGIINGLECWFYVIKIQNGSTIYFISNDQLHPLEVIRLYRIRWKIELFHRTAKQYLGANDCQMRAIEKQRQHILYVMQAYAISSIRMALMGVDCVEDVINHFRDVKIRRRSMPKSSTVRNFDYVV